MIPECIFLKCMEWYMKESLNLKPLSVIFGGILGFGKTVSLYFYH